MSESTKARTNRLLGMSAGELVIHCQDITQQRDELLAALLRLRGCIHETRGPNAWEALTQADEAIARAQGEAKCSSD